MKPKSMTNQYKSGLASFRWYLDRLLAPGVLIGSIELEDFLTLRACPPTLLTISALGSARGHLRHEHNSKGPSWGEGPLGGPLGPPLGRWQPLRKRLKHFGPKTLRKTMFFENRRWRGVRGRRKTSRLPNTLTEGSTVFLKENCPPGSFE